MYDKVEQLLCAFEPLLIAIEPIRQARQEEIDRLVAERQAEADRKFLPSYHVELRNTLERDLRLLCEALTNANNAFDLAAKDAGYKAEAQVSP